MFLPLHEWLPAIFAAMIRAIVFIQQHLSAMNYRLRQSGQLSHMNAKAFLCPARLNAMQVLHAPFRFLHRQMEISHSRQVIGTIRQFVIMRRK